MVEMAMLIKMNTSNHSQKSVILKSLAEMAARAWLESSFKNHSHSQGKNLGRKLICGEDVHKVARQY